MDEGGYAHFSAIENLARRAGVSNDEATAAVACFLAPDANSGDPSNEGRRVERVPGGFIILNAVKYRETFKREIEKANVRKRVAKHRQTKNKMLQPVTVTARNGAISETPMKREAENVTVCNGVKRNVTFSNASVYALPLPIGKGKGRAAFKAEIPEGLKTPEFLKAWDEWIKHRGQIGKKFTELAQKKLLKKLASYGPHDAIAAIDHSIENGWIGCFKPKKENQNANRQNPQTNPFRVQAPPGKYDRFSSKPAAIPPGNNSHVGSDEPSTILRDESGIPY